MRLLGVVVLSLLVGSCAAVDQFGSRIGDGNLNSQNALNQETLLNIIRARDLQPLNFFAITQVTGGQTETLNTGLPTITLGPAQTLAQHQFQVSNSLSSGASGGYQANPLVSTAFQTAMLSPIDAKTVALLVASHPREPVFYAVMSQIAFRQSNTGRIFVYVGDPSGDTRADCPQLVRATPDRRLPSLTLTCNYSLFQNYLEVFVLAGLTSELITTAVKPKPATGSGSSASPPSAPTGHICFNPALSNEGAVEPACGAAASSSAAKSSPQFEIPGFGIVEVEFTFRSPLGVFAHFGDLLRSTEGNRVDYHTNQSIRLLGNEPYLDIDSEITGPCFTAVTYNGQSYCVPLSSRHTAMLMDILIQLRNLSIQASDLNSAFTVRLTN